VHVVHPHSLVDFRVEPCNDRIGGLCWHEKPNPTRLILGLIVGFIGSKIVGNQGRDAKFSIVVGIVGAIFDGLIFSALGAGCTTRICVSHSALPNVSPRHRYTACPDSRREQ